MAKKKIGETLSSKNWKYQVSYDYDSDNSGCTCTDYCRCGRIINVKINHVPNPWEIVNIFYEKESKLAKYCIDRILTCLKIYLPDQWDVNICSGYYGEEVGSVRLRNGNTFEGKIQELLSLKNDTERIRYALNLEYGFLLDSIKNVDWTVIKVAKSEIVFPQDTYVKKLDSLSVDQYRKYPFARGIVLSDGDRYKVVDGYHRLSAAPSKGKFDVVVGDNS